MEISGSNRMAPVDSGKVARVAERIIRLSLCLGWVICCNLWIPRRAAADGSPLTLQAAVSKALQANPQVQIAVLEAGKSHDALGEARSVYLPRFWVSSTAGYSNRWNEKLRAVDGSGQERVYGLTSLGATDGFFNVGVDQVLVDLKRWSEIGQAARGADVARAAEAVRREQIAAEVIQRYSEILRLEHHLAIETERQRRAMNLDTQSAAFAKVGRALPSDLALVRLGADSARADVQARSADLAGAREALMETLELEVDGNAVARAPVALVEDSLPGEDRLGRLDTPTELSQAPDLRLLDFQQQLAQETVNTAKAGRFPTVTLRGQYSNYGPKRYDNYPDELRVGIDARLTLFDGMQTDSAIAEAQKGLAVARLQYRSALEQKRCTVRALTRRLAALQTSGALATQRAQNTREQFRLAGLHLETGRGSLAEVADALDGWTRTEHDAVDAHFDRVVVWATLQREAGQLIAALDIGDAAPAESR